MNRMQVLSAQPAPLRWFIINSSRNFPNPSLFLGLKAFGGVVESTCLFVGCGKIALQLHITIYIYNGSNSGKGIGTLSTLFL